MKNFIIIPLLCLSFFISTSLHANDLAEFQRAYKNLKIEDRKNIQAELFAYGISSSAKGYKGNICGQTDQNTLNAIKEAYDDSAPFFYKEVSEEEFLSLILEPFEFWGEGGEGWEEENNFLSPIKNEFGNNCPNIEQNNSTQFATAKTQDSFFKSLNISCNVTPLKDIRGVKIRAESWEKFGNNELMAILDNENYYSLDSEANFNKLVKLNDSNPEFPPLQFWTGYGYMLRGDFNNSLSYFAKAASRGEPNSAYLVAIIALGFKDQFENIKLDDSFSENPNHIALIRDCLEVSYSTPNLKLAFSDRQYTHYYDHQTYFVDESAFLLVSTYLKDSSGLNGYKADWSAEKLQAKKAKEIINQYISYGIETDDCDKSCWKRLKEIANTAMKNEFNEMKASLDSNMPDFISRAPDKDNLFSYDLTSACRAANPNEQPIPETGTEFSSVTINSNICANVVRLSNKNYKCSMGILGSGTFDSFSRNVTIDDYFLRTNNEVSCMRSDNASILLKINSYSVDQKLSEKDVEIVLGDGRNVANKIIVKGNVLGAFLQNRSKELLDSKINEVQFSCKAFNACNVTGRELAKFILKNKSSISVFEPALETERDWLGNPVLENYLNSVSTFGEVLKIKSPEKNKRTLRLLRGSIDDFSPGGISL